MTTARMPAPAALEDSALVFCQSLSAITGIAPSFFFFKLALISGSDFWVSFWKSSMTSCRS